MGRDPATVRRSVGLYTIVGEDDQDLRRRIDGLRSWGPGLDDASPEELSTVELVGTPEQVLERVSVFADLGVEELILTPAQVPFAIPDAEMLDLIADRIVAPARGIVFRSIG